MPLLFRGRRPLAVRKLQKRARLDAALSEPVTVSHAVKGNGVRHPFLRHRQYAGFVCKAVVHPRIRLRRMDIILARL